jgi:hypothetical protein
MEMTEKFAPKEVWVICCGDSTTVFATLGIALMARDVMESLGHTPEVVKAPMFWPLPEAKPKGRPKGSRNRNKDHGGSARKAEAESAPAMPAAPAAAPASDPFELGEFKRT